MSSFLEGVNLFTKLQLTTVTLALAPLIRVRYNWQLFERGGEFAEKILLDFPNLTRVVLLPGKLVILERPRVDKGKQWEFLLSAAQVKNSCMRDQEWEFNLGMAKWLRQKRISLVVDQKLEISMERWQETVNGLRVFAW